MAQAYKVTGFNITGADTKNTIYSCPASTTALVNSVYFGNRDTQTGINDAASLYLYDSSAASTYAIMSGVLLPGQASIQPLSAPLVLESGDYLQAADTSGFADVTVNILEIT